MRLHNFENLIKKYSKGQVISVIETPGYYDQEDGGLWIDGKKEEILLDRAAIVPLTFEELKFVEGGTHDSDNKKLYCYKHLRRGTVIKNTQRDETVHEYKIINEKDYSDFDFNEEGGLHIYYLKRAVIK